MHLKKLIILMLRLATLIHFLSKLNIDSIKELEVLFYNL